jgi:hypothetical protein
MKRERRLRPGEQLGHNPDEPTYIYVVECAGKVKIGIAANVEARIGMMQLHCPVRINIVHRRLFATRNNARHVEKQMHVKFAAHRLWGEWFEMEPTLAIDAVVAAEEIEVPTLWRNVKRRLAVA